MSILNKFKKESTGSLWEGVLGGFLFGQILMSPIYFAMLLMYLKS